MYDTTKEINHKNKQQKHFQQLTSLPLLRMYQKPFTNWKATFALTYSPEMRHFVGLLLTDRNAYKFSPISLPKVDTYTISDKAN